MIDNLDEITELDAEYKIILVGDNNTGKTCLFKKITSGEFSPQNVSTIGFDQKSIEFIITTNENTKKRINIILVDTAGQKRYADLTKSYFKGCNGILLLYSIIDKNSFNNLSQWLEGVKNNIVNHEDNKYLIFLMGTKSDMVEKEEDKNLREVTEDEAFDFCNNNNLLWYGECSSKNCSKDLFLQIFGDFDKKLYETIGFNKIARDSLSTLDTKKTKKQKKHCSC